MCSHVEAPRLVEPATIGKTTGAWRDRTDRFGVWIILAVALSADIWRLDVKNLWLDECASWDLATRSVTALLSSTAADIHPPLYYLILKAWVACLGDSPIGLRSLSVLSSLVSLWLMSRLAATALSRGAKHAALLWFALSPNVVSYSQEARMYAMATTAVLAMCLAYRRWVESGFHSRRALVAYVACATVGAYLHYFTAFVILAVWMHAIMWACGGFSRTGGARRFPLRDWLCAHAAIAVLYGPWIGTAISQVKRGQPWRQPVAADHILNQASELVRRLIFGVYDVPSLTSPRCAIVLLILAGGLVGATIGACRRAQGERHTFFLLVTVVPVFFGLTALPLAGYLDLSRYLLYVTPVAILAAADGLRTWRIPAIFVTCALVISAIAPLASLRAYYGTPIKDYDARPIVSYLTVAARHRAPEAQDPILVAPGYVTDLLRYLSRGNLVYERLDSDADFEHAISTAIERHGTLWLIADYRWPAFDQIAHDPRMESLDIPSSLSARVRLFRTVGSAADLNARSDDRGNECPR